MIPDNTVKLKTYGDDSRILDEVMRDLGPMKKPVHRVVIGPETGLPTNSDAGNLPKNLGEPVTWLTWEGGGL